MNLNIAVLAGDGIGPEITAAAIKALNKVGEKCGHTFSFNYLLAGGAALDACGNPMPDQTVLECKKADAVLLGAVGGPKWDVLPGHLRPEKGLLKIRAELGLYANIRPARLFASLKDACPLRSDIADSGIDMIVVRELTGGMYFGERGIIQKDGETAAFDTELYKVSEIQRITKIACEIAKKRKKELISIDKANVLESSRLWRKVVHEFVEANYPDIRVTDMLVDNAAMQLVKNPAQFDVIVTSNMFGDILSDEAAMITGSIGMLASSSLGDGKGGLYEPIHGSAPDIAGKDLANPIATILSCAMMLKDFSLNNEARLIERAVDAVLQAGYRTADIYSGGKTRVSGSKMLELILSEI